jgi:hypothetical protein
MKLITFPEQVHWTDTREFSVLTDSGTEMKIKVTESPDGMTVYTEENSSWVLSEDKTIHDWIENELEVEQMRMIFEEREQDQIEKENQTETD